MAIKYRIARKTRQRMSAKKFQNLSQHAHFLAKHIRRFISFDLLEQASLFSENLNSLLWENPKLRKKFPVLEKITQELDEIFWQQVSENVRSKIDI